MPSVKYPVRHRERLAMATLYVASSKGLAKWGSDHGVAKYLYKVGVTNEDPAATIERLNAEQHDGRSDWRLAKKVAMSARTKPRSSAPLPPRRS